MGGRLALSRRRQDGRPADGMLPLTERLLGRLPGPRVAWVLAWAAIPIAGGLLPGAYRATVGAKPLPFRLLIGLVFAYALVLAFWAVGRFTSGSDTVQRSVDQLAAPPGQTATPVFGGMASTRGPLALTLLFVAVTTWRTAVLGGLWAALRWLPVTVLVNPPLLTAFWIYGAGFAPVLVINFANPLGLLLLLGLFLRGVGIFFGCLQGLHHQLLATRRH